MKVKSIMLSRTKTGLKLPFGVITKTTNGIVFESGLGLESVCV